MELQRIEKYQIAIILHWLAQTWKYRSTDKIDFIYSKKNNYLIYIFSAKTQTLAMRL